MEKRIAVVLCCFLGMANISRAQSDTERIKSLEEQIIILTQQVAEIKASSSTATSNQNETIEDVKKMDLEQKIEEIKAKIPFGIAGSVDAYIQTNFAGKHTNTVYNEAFPNKANSFELGMLNLMFSKEIKKVGFVGDIGFGPRAEAANNTLYSNTILAIKQLYMTYAPTDWLKFTLGNFSTFLGYELIEPQNNFHYSTSMAFQNGPFYHTGFKAEFTKKKWNVLLGFFDDTDTKSDDHRSKYVGGQVGYTTDRGGLYINYIGGNEQDTLYSKRKYKSSLGITGSIDVGKKKKGTISGDAAYYRWRLKKDDVSGISNAQFATAYLYGKYMITDKAGIGARAGYLYNPDGYAPSVVGGAKHYADFTLSAQYHIAGILRLVPEFRVDYASEKVFTNHSGNPSNFQYRLLLATIFAF